jgi:hypothetical protein
MSAGVKLCKGAAIGENGRPLDHQAWKGGLNRKRDGENEMRGIIWPVGMALAIFHYTSCEQAARACLRQTDGFNTRSVLMLAGCVIF